VASVLDYLIGRGRPFLVLPETGAGTVREAATAQGIDLAEAIRTEVVITSTGPALMLVRAAEYLDLRLARGAANDPAARLATHAEIRTFAPECELAAVPPLSLLLRAPMYVDPAVAQMKQVVFAAGRPSVLVCMEREDLFRDDPYVVVPLTRSSAASAPEPTRPPPSRRAILADDELVPIHLLEQRRAGRPADVA